MSVSTQAEQRATGFPLLLPRLIILGKGGADSLGAPKWESPRSFVLRTQRTASSRGKPSRRVRGQGGAEETRQRVPQRLAHPRTRLLRTRPGRWERRRVRASPTRRAAHLAPPRRRWRAAASYS